jgi:trimeric autotransporter adhesin
LFHHCITPGLRLHLAVFAAIISAGALSAAQQTGTVRAADQFIPGASVTATQGDQKVVGFTDANGRYALNLGPGVWNIQVEMLGFTTVHQQITVGAEPVFHDWILEMPRVEGSTSAAVPNTPGRGRRGFGQGRGGGRGGAVPANPNGTQTPQQRPGFQNAAVTPTPEGQQALADAANQTTPVAGTGDDAEDAFLVNGSTSGGLGQSSDDETQRQRAMAAGRGGPPGGMMTGLPGGPAGLGLPPGMTVAGSDGLGLGGLGTSAINGGFTDGLGGGPPGGPSLLGGVPGGPGFGGGGGRGGGGGGGGGGRGGGRGGRGNQNQNRRGPYNGEFSSFGNRRRNAPPAYTGSVFITLANSAFNAAPYSLNGQSAAKPSSDNAHFGVNVGGPMVIPKILNWKRAAFYFTYQGVVSRNPYSQVSSVPTLAERGGNFSAAQTNTPVTIFDPTTGSPFPGNIIPATRISPVALGLLQYIPQPTFPGVTENYRIVTSTPSNNNNVGIRLNAPLNDKDRINFNVQY